jgi:sodium transport system ATP-binding protein
MAAARRVKIRARGNVGFLSGSMGLYERLTAKEMLEYFAGLQGLSGARLRQTVDSIARAVLHDPPVLILDEPTVDLDILSGRTIFAPPDRLARPGSLE